MPTINGPGILVTGESKKPIEEKVTSGASPSEKRKITETIKGLGHKAAEKTETNVKTLDEQLKELRKTAKDEIARSTNYITAGAIAAIPIAVLSVVDEVFGLGVPPRVYELGFAASLGLIFYGVGKAVGLHRMDREIEKLEKERSARIKEESQAAKKPKIQH